MASKKLKDFYKILGLERTASPEEIDLAYKKASTLPDLSPAMLKDISTGYQILKNPDLRARLDSVLGKMDAYGGVKTDSVSEPSAPASPTPAEEAPPPRSLSKLKNYYKILNIERNANKDEIEKAYGLAIAKVNPHTDPVRAKDIEVGHQALMDDATRKKYDDLLLKQEMAVAEITYRTTRPNIAKIAKGEGKGGVARWQIALLTVCLLGAIPAGFYIATAYWFYFRSFEINDPIYEMGTGEYVGILDSYEKNHSFPPNNVQAPAYRVRFHDGEEKWFPKSDLQAMYSTVPPEQALIE